MATGGPSNQDYNSLSGFWAAHFERFFKAVAPNQVGHPASTTVSPPPDLSPNTSQVFFVIYRSESPHPVGTASPNLGRSTPVPMVEVGGAVDKPKPTC